MSHRSPSPQSLARPGGRSDARLALVAGQPGRRGLPAAMVTILLDPTLKIRKARRTRRAFSLSHRSQEFSTMYMTNLAARRRRREARPASEALALLYAGDSARPRPRRRACSTRSSRAGSTSPRSPRCWSRCSIRGETDRRADRRRPGAARRRRAVRPARLSLRRQLRHRRRRLGDDQPLDRGRLRRGGGGAAGRQARQPLGHLALRLGRRARASRRQARLPRPRPRGGRSTRPASASCSRRSTIRASATPGRCGARSASARS